MSRPSTSAHARAPDSSSVPTAHPAPRPLFTDSEYDLITEAMTMTDTGISDIRPDTSAATASSASAVGASAAQDQQDAAAFARLTIHELAAPLEPAHPSPPPVIAAGTGPSRSPPPPAASGAPTSAAAARSPNLLAAAGQLLERIDPEVSGQVREVGWSLLERFAMVTRASRDTATRVLDHPLARPILPILPRDVQRMSTQYRPEDHTGPVIEEIAREFPAASIYLAQWVQSRVMGHQGAGLPTGPGGAGQLHEPEVWEDSDEETEFGGFGVLSTESSMPKPVSKRSASKKLTAEQWILYTTSNFRQSIPIIEQPISETNAPPLPASPVGSSSSQESQAASADDGVDVTAVIDEIKERIFLGGVDPDIRPQVWKFLLGYLPWGSTQLEQDKIVAAKTEHYERFKSQWTAFSSTTLTPKEWEDWTDERHRIVKDVIVRTDRHHPFYASPTNAADGTSLVTNLDEEELLMVLPPVPTDKCSAANVNANLQRLASVLTTYVHYLTEIGRAELGYVQGMSDLCAVLLLLQDGSEVDAFWCFVGLMERLHTNFHMNQQAMHYQLTTLKSLLQFIDYPLFRHLATCDALNMFFAFRWLLIWFKREFSLPDVMRIWETSLADTRSQEWHLFIALAIVEHVRGDLVARCTRFDEVLKLVNELADNIPVDSVLDTADELFQVFEAKMASAQAAIREDAEKEKVSPGAWPKEGTTGAAAGASTSSPSPSPSPPPRPAMPIRELDKVLAKQLRSLTNRDFSVRVNTK
ncbi:rab-GTPase-TBC domain-containing protein [Catenaria anguillulae PL171]|uniref:Rab-GTPase-TBC domain-containing protein n=1 Tax=Catenaria anguillulae PL171 TaxID=765915 RepID=A0A1Y2I3S5_9FUNG|nr:rab-GTPase-TBC domain-containing protein [Catenaria anguillulae PL171]